MNSRPRHHGQPDAPQDPYKPWRAQEKQAESDSERPRYKITTTNQPQRDQRDTSYRGYKSDSPATASTSQYRPGTSTSRPSNHTSRPSVPTSHVSRPQQPASNSTTPSAQQSYYTSRGQPQRSQPEIYDSRPYKPTTSHAIPTPQPYERVPSADDIPKSSRTHPILEVLHQFLRATRTPMYGYPQHKILPLLSERLERKTGIKIKGGGGRGRGRGPRITLTGFRSERWRGGLVHNEMRTGTEITTARGIGTGG